MNANNVAMYDEMSIFWISWEDVRLYFASLEVARVHDGWSEVRRPDHSSEPRRALGV